MFIKKLSVVLFSLIFCFITITIVTSQSFAAGEKKDLIVAYDPWPPFTDDKDPNFGICIVITSAVFKSTKYKVIAKNIPAKRADVYLRGATKIDASAYYWYTEERAKHFIFSEPFLYNTVHFFVRSDSDIKYNSLKDLKPYTIGIMRNYYNGDEFDNAAYLKKEVNNTNEIAIKKLLGKRFDLALIDKIVAETLIKDMKIQGKLKMLPDPLFTAGLHFIVGKKHPDGLNMIKTFNQGLAKIKKNGEYARILKSYGVTGTTIEK